MKHNIFHSKKTILIKFLILSQLFSLEIIKVSPLSAEITKREINSEYLTNIPDRSSYIIGPGDILNLQVSEKSEELNQIITINGEGTTILKRLKTVYVSGLTISDLTKLLNVEYSQYVKNPDVKITIEKYKPIEVYINGEVESPGKYILPGSYKLNDKYINDNSNISSERSLRPFNQFEKELNNTLINTNSDQLNQLGKNYESRSYPKITDALKASGGLSFYADLTNVKVTRLKSFREGGGRKTTTLNILSSLEGNDISQNIRIYDGDSIYVSKTEDPLISQLSSAIKSNINPKFINIYLGGRVERPGKTQVNKLTSLNEAIEMVGGTKVLKGPARFIRYLNDGTIDKRKFALNKRAKRGSYKNPYLSDGDIIYVGRSSVNVAAEVINEITEPFQGIVSSIGLYQVITGD